MSGAEHRDSPGWWSVLIPGNRGAAARSSPGFARNFYNGPMIAEVLSIGTELTTGQNLDTNSQWLSLRLAEIGIPVGWHTTVADDLDANVEAFAIASHRARLVIATGGLGPTQDDLTREVLARLAGVPLVFHEPSFETIRKMFASRGRQMPE